MSSLAIITARGGSKRIPHKNIKEFCGKPIICYTIEAALASGVFDEVMVSTDDEEIARIAREAGAEVPFFRSAETANDQATTADVLTEVVQEYEKRGKHFETACCLYPTAPFLTPERLREADPDRRTIQKERYCLADGNQYFEIDIYPFWNDKAILEIELSDPDEEIRFPSMIKIIKEVTEDKNYKNASLARII